MSRLPARGAAVATRRAGRTVRAERGDRSASTAARSRRAPAGPGCGRPRGDDPELEPAAQEDRLGRWGDEPDADRCVDAPVSVALSGCPSVTCRHRPDRGFSKSAASRRFVALSAARLADSMAADLSALHLLSKSTRCISATISCWSTRSGLTEGNKHPLALVEGATENAATVQAMLDNVVSRGLLARQCQDCSSSTARKRCRRDPPHLRSGRRDPALPDPQGAQNHGTPAERASCGHMSRAPPGLGARCRQG